MEAIFAAVFIAVCIVLLNLASAGAAALLYLKRPDFSRARRNVLAICLPAVIPALLFIVFSAVSGSGTAANSVLIITMLIFGGIGGLLAIPGAIVMSRMVERGPRLGDTFT